MPSAWIASRPPAGQTFRHEAALGADRHDDRVLDVLRLDQTEDFGAEILRPVGPANAAPRHFAEAQMHALDPRRIDKDFVERPRQRQAVDLAARKLDRDGSFDQTVGAELIKIGADRRRHRVDEVAQDAVLVEAIDRLPSAVSISAAMAASRAARSSGGSAEMRIEAGVEQAHDAARRRPAYLRSVVHI